MTEQEVIEVLEKYILQLEHSIAEGECTEQDDNIENALENDKKSIGAFEIAITALRENQEYHKIGTVKKCRELISTLSKVEKNELPVIIDEWCEYHKIGTLEEVRNQKHNLSVAYKIIDEWREYCKLGTLEKVRNQKHNLSVAYKIIADYKSAVQSDWIPVEKRLPESNLNPVTRDAYEYPVTVDFGDVTDVRYYSYWEGHWYNNSPFPMDKYVTAWMDRPQPYKAEACAGKTAKSTGNKPAYWRDRTQFTDFAFVECSACGYRTENFRAANWNYCPNCGCKMAKNGKETACGEGISPERKK